MTAIRFGPFSFDLVSGELLHHGRSLEIQRKPLEVLTFLIERAGELVTREQLYERLWPDGTHVDFEHGLNTAVRKLRRALGESPETPRFLETMAGRGYCFHAGPEPPKDSQGFALAMRAEESGEAPFAEFATSVALWRGELLEPAPPTLVAGFSSGDDAVRCASALVQRARARAAAGRLRLGLGEGQAGRLEALRLCAAAGPGQTLAAASLIAALEGHDGLRIRDHPPVTAPGATSVMVVALEASTNPSPELLGRPPFVGRSAELDRLMARLQESGTGRGGLVLLRGEPGIGKTRLIEEFSAHARRTGTVVLLGRCMESGASSHQPLADALDNYLCEMGGEELRATIPIEAASVVARIVPALREHFSDLTEPPALRPDEDLLRLLDAIAQTFAAIARRAPVLLAFDDLHWADSFTAGLIAHLGRGAAHSPLLILGSYRDTSPVGANHPLARMLERGELESRESIALTGLDPGQVHSWLESVAPGRSSGMTAASVHRASGGNPFFVRELLLGWAGQLRSAPAGHEPSLHFDASALPRGVLELIVQRIATLSEPAKRLLIAASVAGQVFRFDVVARAAGLEEDAALDALDESYDARLVRSTGGIEDSEFFHALTRQALYESITPARCMRLHRRLGQELSRVGGARAAEVAEHYHSSRQLPGAETGAGFALEAASLAETSVDFEAAARLLRIALDLLPKNDPRRARTLHRLALALAWSGGAAEAAHIASQAGAAIAADEGPRAAAVALADAADVIWLRSYDPAAGTLAETGLQHAGDQHDLTWMRLAAHRVLQLEAMNPDLPKLPTDTPMRREVSRGFLALSADIPPRIEGDLFVFDSRAEAIELGGHMPGVRLCWIGDYRGALSLYRQELHAALERGRLTVATDRLLSGICLTEVALGNLDAADAAVAHAEELFQRSEPVSFLTGVLRVTKLMRAKMRGEGVSEVLGTQRRSDHPNPSRSFRARNTSAMFGAYEALRGNSEEALRLLDFALPALEQGPGWWLHQTLAIANGVEILWRVETRRHAETIENCLLEKTLKPDFRFPDTDARLSMARLCALSGRCDEASAWFAKARVVLDEQGARPLRAITDFDEAWMVLRRGASGDRERARPLLDAAVAQFESIGMPGWVRRAEEFA